MVSGTKATDRAVEQDVADASGGAPTSRSWSEHLNTRRGGDHRQDHGADEDEESGIVCHDGAVAGLKPGEDRPPGPQVYQDEDVKSTFVGARWQRGHEAQVQASMGLRLIHPIPQETLRESGSTISALRR